MSHKLVATLFALTCALFATNAKAITYNVDLTIGAGTAVGYITTDDTLGGLNGSNITDWRITLTAPNINAGTPTTIGPTIPRSDAGVLTATATDILFDPNASGVAIFQVSNFLCFDGVNSNCSGAGDGSISIGRPDGGNGFAQRTLVTGIVSIASVAAVPLPAGLPLIATALVGLGILRRRRKLQIS